MFDAILLDVRYALRSFRASPGFTLVVVLTLGLSVGANAALFSVVNALVLRRLPVSDPDRLVMVGVENERGQEQPALYLPTFQAFMAQQRSFSAASLYTGGGNLPAQVRGGLVDGGLEGVTKDYYTVLGVRPLLGRTLRDTDFPATGDAVPVVVLSWQFWQRTLGGDPDVIGETLVIITTPLTIVGVMPQDFHGLQVDGGADFTMPLRTVRDLAGDKSLPPRGYNIIGRLRPDVSLEQARAEVQATWPALQEGTLPAGLSSLQVTQMRSLRTIVQSIRGGFSNLRKQYASAMSMLLALTGVLLAIGCANLSGLLLARTISRGPQTAVRIALGAARGRLIQQVAVEALLLATAGAALAVPMAWWVSGLLSATIWSSATRPLALAMTPDARVFVVAGAVTIAAALLVAVLPAWLATGRGATLALGSSRNIGSSITRSGRALLVLQVALSLILIFGAGLFGQSLMRLRSNAPTIDGRRVVWGRLWLRPEARAARFDATYYRDLSRRITEGVGADRVAYSGNFPAMFNLSPRPEPVARANADDAEDVDALLESASPDFFETVGIPRLRGRDFTWSDDTGRPPVAILSAQLADKLFPGADAVGRTIWLSRATPRTSITVVGVVADAAVINLRDRRPLVLYRPLLQDAVRSRQPIVHVRTRGTAGQVSDALTRIAGSGGSHFIRRALSLDTQVRESVTQERLLAGVASGFAVLAVIIASIGLYGFLAYSVARRTREIGVRMALGASRSAVHAMVLRDGITLTAAGLAAGIPCALAIAPVSRSLLYGIGPIDMTSIVGASVVFAAVAVIACWIPAHRASAIDPMTALRRD